MKKYLVICCCKNPRTWYVLASYNDEGSAKDRVKIEQDLNRRIFEQRGEEWFCFYTENFEEF